MNAASVPFRTAKEAVAYYAPIKARLGIGPAAQVIPFGMRRKPKNYGPEPKRLVTVEAKVAECFALIEEMSERNPGLRKVNFVIAAMARIFEIPRHSLTTKARVNTEYRQIAMAIAVEVGISLMDVGRTFGRDHATVWYAKRKYRPLIERAKALTGELPDIAHYEVIGSRRDRRGCRGLKVIRRFADHDLAIEYALTVDMDHWRDVWVRPCAVGTANDGEIEAGARAAIRQINSDTRLDSAVDIVAGCFGLSPLEIRSSSRAVKYATPRQLAMAICRIVIAGKGVSFGMIGAACGGRTADTVSHAVEKYRPLIERVRDLDKR